MKVYFPFYLTLSFALIFISCREKKETDALGNSIKETKNQTENVVDPLVVKGQELFEGTGTCATCHKADVKIIGPSIREIAKIYKEQNASIASFINGEGTPLVDPSQYEIMKANFVITKALSETDRKALELYMMQVE